MQKSQIESDFRADAFAQLARLDRCERRALSRRKFAIRELDALQRHVFQRLGGNSGTLGTTASNNVNTSFNGIYSITMATALPAALPLFAGGLGVIGLLARRRKRKAVVTIAA